MAARSELGHRMLELKTSAMGRIVPRVLSHKTNGFDGLLKKVAAKSSPADVDDSLASDLLHPDDVPEIVTGWTPQRPEEGASDLS